jgi:ADP-heptose:LPS heptosyltransferase
MIEPKNLLIIRADRIGDVVLTLPMAGEIKKVYPDCHVTFLAREYTALLPGLCSSVDRTLTMENDGGKAFIEILREYNFDCAIIVSPEYKYAEACFRARIPHRVGTAYRWYSFLFNHRIKDHRKYVRFHELEYNLRMLAPFGISAKTALKSARFDLSLTTELLQSADSLLARSDSSPRTNLVIIHPGSGGSSVDLPVNKFRELAGMLCSHPNIQLVLTGTDAESSLCAEIGNHLPVLDLSGQLTMSQLTGIIGRSDIFISNSTGPLHIAAAFGKQVIGFYPKILVCSAARWGPYSPASRVFTPPIPCENCMRKQCDKLQCMHTISMLEVYNYIITILKDV